MLNFNFYKGLIESDTIENIQELFKNFNKKMCHDFSENNCIMSWNNLYNKINFTNYNSNAISKIKNKQNPLIGDRRHLHHFLFKKLNNRKTIIVYFLLFITPIFFLYFKILSENYIVIFFLAIYIQIISKLKK